MSLANHKLVFGSRDQEQLIRGHYSRKYLFWRSMVRVRVWARVRVRARVRVWLGYGSGLGLGFILRGRVRVKG